MIFSCLALRTKNHYVAISLYRNLIFSHGNIISIQLKKIKQYQVLKDFSHPSKFTHTLNKVLK